MMPLGLAALSLPPRAMKLRDLPLLSLARRGAVEVEVAEGALKRQGREALEKAAVGVA
jgi:hypothetical protein